MQDWFVVSWCQPLNSAYQYIHCWCECVCVVDGLPEIRVQELKVMNEHEPVFRIESYPQEEQYDPAAEERHYKVLLRPVIQISQLRPGLLISHQ